MGRILFLLWNDDCGFAANTVEWLFMLVVLVVGLLTGLVAMRQALISELAETANALLALDQSFEPPPQTNCESSTAGSSASDTTNTVSFSSVRAGTAPTNQNLCD